MTSRQMVIWRSFGFKVLFSRFNHSSGAICNVMICSARWTTAAVSGQTDLGVVEYFDMANRVDFFFIPRGFFPWLKTARPLLVDWMGVECPGGSQMPSRLGAGDGGCSCGRREEWPSMPHLCRWSANVCSVWKKTCYYFPHSVKRESAHNYCVSWGV